MKLKSVFEAKTSRSASRKLLECKEIFISFRPMLCPDGAAKTTLKKKKIKFSSYTV
jgi:hypothetical protein